MILLLISYYDVVEMIMFFNEMVILIMCAIDFGIGKDFVESNVEILMICG